MPVVVGAAGVAAVVDEAPVKTPEPVKLQVETALKPAAVANSIEKEVEVRVTAKVVGMNV